MKLALCFLPGELLPITEERARLVHDTIAALLARAAQR